MSFPVASQFAWRNRRLAATSGDRDAGLPARASCPGLTVADLGVLAGRPAWRATAAGSAIRYAAVTLAARRRCGRRPARS